MKQTKNSFEQLKRALVPMGILSFFMAVLIELCSLLPIYLMPKVIDQYIPAGNLQAILLSICVFCGVPLLSTMLYNFYQYYLIKNGRRLTSKLNLDCFEKLLYQPMKFYDESYSAEIAKKCSQEAISYVAVWSIDIPNLASNIASSLLVFGLLLQIHPAVAGLQLLYFPVVLLLLKFCGKRLEKLIARVVDCNARIQKYMQEAFHSIRILKSSQLEPFAVKRVDSVQKEVLNIWGKTVFFDNLMGGVNSTFIPGIFYGGTFVLTAVLVMNGQVTLGLLTAALGYASKIHKMFGSLLNTYNNFKKAKGECEAIVTYLGMEDERDNPASQDWSFGKEIRFSDVTFAYPKGDQNILEKKSVVFPKGKWTGISGPSGTGKSTMLELMLRFYDIGDGAITIDGTPLKDISLSQLREHIAYVSQDPFLIDGTIEENLELVCRRGKKEEIKQVAQLTGITDHIENGLQKNVGEAGMLLSGGEKQRVAIAQCLLKDCSVLLLDEVTSQLDKDSQEQMVQLFKRLCTEKGVTIISVAHREDFHRYTDLNYVMEQ